MLHTIHNIVSGEQCAPEFRKFVNENDGKQVWAQHIGLSRSSYMIKYKMKLVAEQFFFFSLWKEELAFLFGCLSRVLSLRVHLFAQCSWMGCHWRKSFDFIGIAATAALFSSFLVCFFIFIVYFGCRLFLALLNWCSYSVLLSGEHRRHTHWLNAVFGAKKRRRKK